MLIDRTHRSWALGTTAVFLAASVLYVIYAVKSPVVSGGSPAGQLYGIAGFGLMVFAGLLALRKKFPIWRIGRAQTWLRGHLWLGLLSFPLILFHAGFDFGGPLTRALMWLFVVVIVSGLLGAALQHYLPGTLTNTVPMETIYEQIPRVRRQLLDEGDGIVAAACGALEIETVTPVQSNGAAGLANGAAGLGGAGRQSGAGGREATSLATIVRLEADDTAPLRAFYRDEMRPLLLDPGRRAPLAEPGYARQRFDRLRTALPPELHPTLADLENICEEERQLARQLTLHHILHGWLLVHIPLSFALLTLAVVHLVVALGY